MAYELVIDEIYEPEYSAYVGSASKLTVEFWGPPQFPGLDWLVDNGLSVALSMQGLTPLKTRIWIDPADWYNSKIKVEATAHDSPIAPVIWFAVIGGLLTVAGLVLITYNIKEIDWGEVGAGLPVSLMTIAGIGIVVLIGATLLRKR